MWTKIKAFFHDLYVRVKTNVLNTVALLGTTFGGLLSHADAALTWFYANVDAFATALGDPNLAQQMTVVLGDAKAIGRWMFAVGVVATIAKFKALVQSPPAPPKV